ncbi:MAG: helix-turn-helix domain-containing protein [Clostridia bacterium]|nr:helix-turn-helix domain-containing protein [Clostridia bacterium]
MNHESTLINLLRWKRDELFYRDYYFADDSKKERMIEETDPSMEARDYVLHPEHLPIRQLEESFFASGQNVYLVPHPRYLPLFTHDHVFFEMLYVMVGECDQLLDGAEKHFTQGDVCLIAPGVKHGIKVFDDSVVINILIRSSTFMDIFLNAVRDKSRLSSFFLGSVYDNRKIPYLTYHTGNDESLRGYLLNMYAEQGAGDSFSDRIMSSLLTIFFAELTRNHSKDMEMPDNSDSPSPYSEQLMSYIISHFDSVTLNDLAAHFHFSVPYCSKLVKTSCGLSFSELITRLRMQHGLSLLESTNMSISDISEQVGYKNPETFIRCFTRTFGKTPSQFRRRA